MLTSHRFLWGRPGDISRGYTCLSLFLRHIVYFEEEIPGPFSFGRSKKIIIHLSEAPIGTLIIKNIFIYQYLKFLKLYKFKLLNLLYFFCR